ncbi:MAG TPA: helix-turn-helix transcriptional regulator [Phycisphaerae bacterium]|nr:helix-turn-helix transcriptional regulator [Phycisphaerae bacterium]
MTQSLEIEGKKFILIPENEYKRLTDLDREPKLPPKNPDGTYPAVAAARVTIARTIIRRRKAKGLTQAELARRAKLRVETLNRIEKAKVTPDTATIAKIDRILSK